MFSRDNVIGWLLLLLCGVVAVILLRAIMTGQRVTWDVPTPVSVVLAIVFVGLLLYGLVGQFRARRGGGPHWPDPRTGRGRRNDADSDR